MLKKLLSYIKSKLTNSEDDHWINNYNMTHEQFMRLPKDIRNALRSKRLDKELERLSNKDNPC
jgi:hypothetical protein